jgi:hypothetical protein
MRRLQASGKPQHGRVSLLHRPGAEEGSQEILAKKQAEAVQARVQSTEAQ